MGGYGSGRPASKYQGTADAARQLDIRWLKQNGRLQPGMSFPVCWSRRGEPSGDIRVIVDGSAASLTLRYRYREGAGEWTAVAQVVPIERTPCNYGGARPWFLCRCGRRVAVLYGTGKHFTCRACSRLCYAVERESRDDRLMSKAMRIRRRLGQTEGGIVAPFPERPKGMHYRTYWRLFQEGTAAELQHLEAGYARLMATARLIDDLKAAQGGDARPPRALPEPQE